MKPTNVLVSALLMIAAMSGCLAEGGQTTSTDSTSAGTSGNRTDTAPDPPMADFIMWAEGNQSLPDENGTFQVAVGMNLTLDASGTIGSNLTFAWDFGDGNTSGEIPGSSGASGGNATSTAGNTSGPTNTTAAVAPLLPMPRLGFQPNQTNSTGNTTSSAPEPTEDGSIIVYAYGAMGNYTLTLYVTDSHEQTDSMSIALAVGQGGPAPGTVLGTKLKKFTKSETCAIVTDYLGAPKTSTFEWVFNATEDDGTPSVVQNVTIKAGSGVTIKFFGPDGKEIKAGAAGAAVEADGPFEAGKYKITASSACAVTGGSRNHNTDAWSTHVST